MVVCRVSRSRRTSSSRQYCRVYSRLPKRTAASRRASSADRPRSISSSTCCARQSGTGGRCRGGRTWSLGGVENPEQNAHVLAQLSDLGLELLPPGGRQRVVLRAMVLLGHAPL